MWEMYDVRWRGKNIFSNGMRGEKMLEVKKEKRKIGEKDDELDERQKRRHKSRTDGTNTKCVKQRCRE